MSNCEGQTIVRASSVKLHVVVRVVWLAVYPKSILADLRVAVHRVHLGYLSHQYRHVHLYCNPATEPGVY
jgi:hypothetical protein